MRTPLNDIITRHKEHISFHTPAHGGVLFGCGAFYRDITELSYSDNLLFPAGVLQESQNEAARACGAENTRYVTGGATLAVQIAVHALKDKSFLVAGPCHRSVFAALRQNGVRAQYLKDIRCLDAALEETGAEVLFYTAPDYYGICSPPAAKKYPNVITVVDEAHGSHFPFSPNLPASALQTADMVIHSLHKTLPVPTGSALLHHKNALEERVAYSFSELHSTSPSYLMLAAIEETLADYAKNGARYYEAVWTARQKFEIEIKETAFCLEKTDDFSRFALISPFNAQAVAAYLEERGVFAECAVGNKIVCIVTPNNAAQLSKLSALLKEYRGFPVQTPHIPAADSGAMLVPVQIVKGTPVRVPLAAAAGRVAAREAGVYPPGVPLFLAGEKITAAHLQILSAHAGRTFGLDNDTLFVVE